MVVRAKKCIILNQTFYSILVPKVNTSMNASMINIISPFRNSDKKDTFLKSKNMLSKTFDFENLASILITSTSTLSNISEEFTSDDVQLNKNLSK